MRLPAGRAIWRALLAASLAVLGGCGSGAPAQPAKKDTVLSDSAPTAVESPRPIAPAREVAVRKVVLNFVDRRRAVRRPDGTAAPRRLTTVVRYPQIAALTASRAPRYPLVLFAHGYALTPQRYPSLLRRWAQAGYVVAAPAFPGERADAPGGPNRNDLRNEPADIRFVLQRLLDSASRRGGRLHGVMDATRVAVAGHSDGGNAALAVAYDRRFRSRRVDAAIVLAGAADIPGLAPLEFSRQGPPLLAVQGSADRVNPPADTLAYFRRARSPKLLLDLRGAGHYGPYVRPGRQLSVVTRVSLAFLDRTLKGRRLSWQQIALLGRRAGVSHVDLEAHR